MDIPQLDLKAQYVRIKEEIQEAVLQVLESQRFILGAGVEEFEQALAEYSGTETAVGVASGTDALVLALTALGISPGDEVITSPYTFVATASAIRRVAARPVFVDIDPGTFNLDVGRLEEAIGKRTRAIIPVHLFGQCAEMDEILMLAKKYGLWVIEDAAQAIGAEYKGKKAGSMGHAGCLSFFPSKNLGAYGDGGAILTDDVQLAEKIRSLRMHGTEVIKGKSVFGLNSRLDAVQAAVLKVKLKYLDGWIEERQKRVQAYRNALADMDQSWLCLPHARPYNRHIYHQFVVRAKDRDGLKEFLLKKRIGTAIYYPVPLHLCPGFADLNYRPGDLPQAEKAAAESLALPIFAELTSQQVDYLAKAIWNFYSP